MATTTNLLLNNQDTGANSNTWGVALNLNFSKIDAKLGNMTTVATTSGTETLTESQERVNVIKCTGTLVGNLTLEFSGRGGTWIIWNATSGAFSVTAKVTGQTGVVIPQSSVVSVFCDGTDIRNGAEQSVLLSAGAAQTITLAAAGEVLALESTDAGASQGPNLSLYRNSASPAASDQLGGISWFGKDSGGTKTQYAGIGLTLTDPVDGSEDAILYFSVMTGGTYVSELALLGTALYPIANDGLALGLATLSFSDLFLASGGVVNWNNGTYTITQSSGDLVFSGTLSLGNADTTLARAAAGMISVEGTTIEPGANRCSFHAHKNGSNQAIASSALTKVTFGTEVFDVGSKFSSSTWTPPAGTCMIVACVGVGSIAFGYFLTLAIYKNGSEYKEVVFELGASGGMVAQCSIIDQCDGDDTYEVYVSSAGDSSYTVLGATTQTYFMGAMV